MNVMGQQGQRDEFAVPDYSSETGDRSDTEPKSGVSEPIPSSFFDRFAWFRDLTIKGKIHAVFGTFFGVSFAMALVLTLGLGELYFRYQASSDVGDGVVAAVEFRGSTGELRYNSVRTIFGGEEDGIERQRESYAVAESQLADLKPVIDAHAPQLADRFAKTQADLISYEATFDALMAELKQGGRSDAATALAYQLSEEGDALYVQADRFAVDLASFSGEIEQNGSDYFFSMISIVFVLGMIGTVILLSGLNYLSGNFARKMMQISDGMKQLSKGKRDFEISDHHRKDEMGDMARSLAMFKRASRQMEIWARERADRADAELRSQQEQAREKEEAQLRKASLMEDVARRLEQSVGEIVNSVASASTQLSATAVAMKNTAQQSSERTRELSRDMTEANSGATAAAAASDEFALSIGEISRQAASSSELARLASGATVEADTTISALSESAEQVGHIVELIQTIAQRTNLLALNASIEAARGGEAGRGFAVVASEVKELAMQTSRATEQIADQIRAMQDTTGASVNALRSIAGQVSELETTAVSIASAVDQQSVAGHDLARSIDLAARGTEKVTGHVDDVRQLSLSTGEAASQVLSSATDLDKQAAALSEQVNAFLHQVREG